MLEGLEVSEVMLSEAIKDNEPKRIDSEYFKKKYLIEDKNRNQFQNLLLGDFSFITDGQHGYHEVDENSNIRHLTAKNAKSFFANDTDADRIAKWVDDNNKRSSLEVDDLILSTRGTVGACAIVGKEILPANIDQDVARIKLTKNAVKHTVLATYINSEIGQDWIIRNQTGMVQQGIALWRVRQMPIPIFADSLQNEIDNVICNAKQKKEQSQFLYRQAEELLLETIGLKDFNPSEKGTNIKSFKESFLATGRLDAEYYQTKYEDYIQLIKKYSGGFDLLQTVCNLKDNNFTPEETKEYQYIELSDIGKSGNVTGCTFAQGIELPSRARRKINTNDVIISSIEGSLESCALITNDYDNALCSTGFYVINSRVINSETLLVLFKSETMQNILKQNCSGTILTAINKNEFLQIPVPLIDKAIQEQISALISESFKLRRESERLLEEAKRAVEMEISKS